MARVMTSYVVIWHGNARYLVGTVDGVIVKTSSLVRLDEKQHIATTRSGSIYAIEEPTDEPPSLQMVGVAEIPLEVHGFCSVRGSLQVFGRAPGGRAYSACPRTYDAQAGLCVASDGRIFRLLNSPAPVAAFSVVSELAPMTLAGDIILYDDCPDGVKADALWAKNDDSAVLRTIQRTA